MYLFFEFFSDGWHGECNKRDKAYVTERCSRPESLGCLATVHSAQSWDSINSSLSRPCSYSSFLQFFNLTCWQLNIPCLNTSYITSSTQSTVGTKVEVTKIQHGLYKHVGVRVWSRDVDKTCSLTFEKERLELLPAQMYVHHVTTSMLHVGTVSFTITTMSGGRIRWPRYFLLAHAAWAPDRPWRYAEMKRVDLFANLQRFQFWNEGSEVKCEIPLSLLNRDSIKTFQHFSFHLLDGPRMASNTEPKFCCAPILLDEI